ncbi:DUF1289 domain-containing protein [Sandarakinorhabdus sp.]|jgi:hypothetical protein|uniref:DUF1289 domain-containing protein n=1 Tax=Sandarakinorhabdus sp. TaxID=1916663 RepID=UPI003564EF6A
MSEALTVASPCTNVCRIDRRSGWCKGCLRSIDEITGWALATDDQRRAVLAALPGRHVSKRGLRQ